VIHHGHGIHADVPSSMQIFQGRRDLRANLNNVRSPVIVLVFAIHSQYIAFFFVKLGIIQTQGRLEHGGRPEGFMRVTDSWF